MSFWNPDTMRAACGGSWLVRPPQIELPADRPADLPLPPLHAPVSGISTDSRSVKPGQAFLAIRGERFDGHAYLKEAAAAGASLLIIDDTGAFERSAGAAGLPSSVGVMKVADTGKALMKLAAAYRLTLLRTKVIAVCGSNGKTTTTRLIDQVLRPFFRGTASIKSFNNAVGVPLTILSARENDQYLICEVGTNAPGEIAELGEVVRPDIAVITSIGREHLEGLGDLAGVAKEEAAMLTFVKPTGCAIVTADATELREYFKRVKNVITFGRASDANLRLTSVQHAVDSDGRIEIRFKVNGRQEARVPLVGEHNALNAIAAMAVARRLTVDEQKAAAALAGARGAEMRLEVTSCRLPHRTGQVHVINDAYNANPDSMIAAIDTALALRRDVYAGSRRVAFVLGEMLELGMASEACHRAVAREFHARVTNAGTPVCVTLIGSGMRPAVDELSALGWTDAQVQWFADSEEENARRIASLVADGDLVLLKGSRGVRLERVMKVLDGSGTPGALGEIKPGSSCGMGSGAPGGVAELTAIP